MATLPALGYKREKSFHKKDRNKPHWPRSKKIKSIDEVECLQQKYQLIDPSKINTFEDFPLSSNTLKGLKSAGYKVPTEIQRESVGLALQGEDILGAAQTGSGKTLAFLIPVLEILNNKQWTRLDGIGALIITPTRELAYQIFETLKKIGKYHDFSAGLIIGGKDLHFEKNRMDQCNIVICTPGRILHHMDVNPLLDCSRMQILVLDEADRCLDLGFQDTMNSIVENLPPIRQTLLFSATQTKSVKDLARLSLKNPKYVAVHESKKYSTPEALEQSYVVCELHEKLKLLWSFIKNHRRQKILIFLSSCKQVKYIYQLFCRLRPGTPLLALYGTLHQLRRMKIYNEFCAKQNVVMFATDIAARGLDFPEVDWVVQLDCPEDADTYIHRAGRTARYCKGGESFLVLLPSELTILEELEAKRIPINQIEVNPSKLTSPVRKIEALLARDPNLKADAQRAFVAYMKSVFLMRNKNVFQVEKLDMKKFAESLGLAVTPRVRFLKKKIKPNEEPNELNHSEKPEVHSEIEESDEDLNKVKQAFSFDEDDDILTIKRKGHDLDNLPVPEISESEMLQNKKKKTLTKVAVAKKLLKKKIQVNRKVIFNEDGKAVAAEGKEKFTDLAKQYEMEDEGGINIEKAREVLKAEDKFDRELFRQRVREKHKEQKRKLKQKQAKDEEDDEEMGARLGSDEEDDGSEPDTSWIPDPDKISTNKEEAKSSDEGDDDDDDHDDHEEEVPNKRFKSKNFNTGLSLEEDEEIALRLLLHNKK